MWQWHGVVQAAASRSKGVPHDTSPPYEGSKVIQLGASRGIGRTLTPTLSTLAGRQWHIARSGDGGDNGGGGSCTAVA